jgi:hypothetical protein
LRKLPDSSKSKQKRLQERRRKAFEAIIVGKGPEEGSSEPPELSEQDIEEMRKRIPTDRFR